MVDVFEELLANIDKGSTDPNDWKAFEAQVDKEIEANSIEDNFLRDGLPFDGPVPPIDLYRKIIEHVHYFPHGDETDHTPKHRLVVGISQGKTNYTLEHLKVLMEHEGVDDKYVYAEGERCEERHSILTAMCVHFEPKRANVERVLSSMHWLGTTYPQLWSMNASGVGLHSDGNPWGYVIHAWEEVITIKGMFEDEKVHLAKEYFLPLRASYQASQNPPKTKLGKFLSKHGLGEVACTKCGKNESTPKRQRT